MDTAKHKLLGRISILTAVFFGMFCVAFACANKADEADCVEAPGSKSGAVKETREVVKIANQPHDPGADWCRTCVMGPNGWASCQIVYAQKMGEDRALIKERSRKNACLDAGFKEGECPAKAVKAVSCKGDAPPKGAGDPGKVLQNIFFKGKEKAATKPQGNANPSSEVPTEAKPK